MAYNIIVILLHLYLVTILYYHYGRECQYIGYYVIMIHLINNPQKTVFIVEQ